MEIFKSKYKVIEFDEENSLIIETYLAQTIDMTEEEFKSEMIVMRDLCEKHCPKRLLASQQDLKFAVRPQIQGWINDEIFVKLQKTIEKIAFLMPLDFVAQLAVEQTMDEEIGKKFNQHFFSTKTDAIDWLLN